MLAAMLFLLSIPVVATYDCGKCFPGTYCNYVTGNCFSGCQEGYQPPRCLECMGGYYGKKCQHTCGRCFNGYACDTSTGECAYGCQDGYRLPTCKRACTSGYYGSNCRKICGKCVSGNACDASTGECRQGCQDGYMQPLCQISTGKVTQLKVTSQSNTSLLISWEEPAMPDGPIEHYTLTVEFVKHLACIESSPVAWLPKDITARSYVLQPLHPYSYYKVEVSAATERTTGPSKIVYGSTLPGVPDVEPEPEHEQPTEYSETLKTLTFNWKEPDCRFRNGPIRYRVRLVSPDPWLSSTNATSVTNAISFLQKDVIPFTTYVLSVWVVNNDNEGNMAKSLNISVKLPPSAPPPVRNLMAYSKDGSQISVRWALPWPPCGEIARYDVYAHQVQDATCQDPPCYTRAQSAPEPCGLWDDLWCATITNLNPESVYSVNVFPKNRNVSDFGEAAIIRDIKTVEGKPSPPSFVNITNKTKNRISLQVGYPDIPNGNMDKFIVTMSVVGDSKEASFNRTIPADEAKRVYKYDIDNLESSTTYQLQVSASTGSGTGEPVTKIFSTPPSEPVISRKPDVDISSVSNSTVKLNLYGVQLDARADSACFVIVKSGGGIVDHDFHLYTLRNLKTKLSEVARGNQFYIAKEISQEDLTVLLGTDEMATGKYGTFTDLALQKHVNYTFGLLCLSEYKDEKSYAVSFAENNFNLEAKGSPEERKSDGDSYSVIIGIIAAAVIIAILAAAIIIYRKKKTPRASIHREEIVLPIYDRMERSTSHGPEKEVSHSPYDAYEDQENEEVIETYDPSPPESTSRPVKLINFEKYVERAISSHELQTQHEISQRVQTRTNEYGKLPQNKVKNRYGNLVPFDHTRVILEKLPSDMCSDYINANYIDGYNCKKAYIATQGPKENTTDDFWRMVWQEGVKLIVMLTNVVENEKKKCEKYWPNENQTECYGEVEITYFKTNILLADYIIRELTVQKNGKERQVIHAHFTSWPDHGVPFYPQSVGSFAKRLMLIPSGPGPILVHCSAGVGRTGTIILLDTMLKRAAAEASIDCLKHFSTMRTQRPNMIDSYEQYKFVHLTLVEVLFGQNWSIPCTDFRNRLPLLKSETGRTGQMHMDEQFRKLEETRFKLPKNQTPIPQELEKIRVPEIYPGPHSRIFISSYESGPAGNFINAVSVNGYQHINRFIATQLPLPHTQSHFWQMVYEHKSHTIVVLQEPEQYNQNTPIFWPKHAPISFDCLTLEVREESTPLNIVQRQITMTNSDNSAERSRLVSMLHFPGWNRTSNLPTSSDLLSLYCVLERVHPPRGGPITLVCYDGASACGLFAGVSFVFDKMKLEQEVDVYLAAKIIRQSHTSFIPNVEQYRHCYDCALNFLEAFETYNNFE